MVYSIIFQAFFSLFAVRSTSCTPAMYDDLRFHQAGTHQRSAIRCQGDKIGCTDFPTLRKKMYGMLRVTAKDAMGDRPTSVPNACNAHRNACPERAMLCACCFAERCCCTCCTKMIDDRIDLSVCPSSAVVRALEPGGRIHAARNKNNNNNNITNNTSSPIIIITFRSARLRLRG